VTFSFLPLINHTTEHQLKGRAQSPLPMIIPMPMIVVY